MITINDIKEEFPHCNIQENYDGYIITINTLSETYSELLSKEMLHSADKDILNLYKENLKRTIEKKMFEEFCSQNNKGNGLIVTPYINQGTMVVHPADYHKILLHDNERVNLR